MIGDRLSPAVSATGIALLVVMAAAVLTWVGIHNLLVVVALSYAMAYMGLAYRWPLAGLTLIIAAVPFQNDLSAGGPLKFSVGELNLLLFTPIYLWRAWTLRRQLLPMGPLGVPMLLWFGVSIFTTMFHWLGPVAVVSIVQMVLYLVVTVIVFGFALDNRLELRTCLYWLVAVGAFLGTCAMCRAPGADVLGMQKNGIGGSLGAAVVVCIELWLSEPRGRARNWLMMALLLTTGGMIFTLSRGAWLGAITGMLVVLIARRQVGRFLRLTVLIVPIVAICWHFLPEDKKSYALSFDTQHPNILLRYQSVAYAMHLFEQQPIIGMGVGWRKLYDATNLVLLTMAETGLAGLFAFALLHGVFFGCVWKARKSVPTTDPRFTYLVLGAALVLAKLTHGLVDHYWGRGSLGIAWSAAGMAWGVTMATRARSAATVSPSAGSPSAVGSVTVGPVPVGPVTVSPVVNLPAIPSGRRNPPAPQPLGATAIAMAR